MSAPNTAIPALLLLAPAFVAAIAAPAPPTTPPRLLAQTGLYAEGTQTVAPGNLPYAPQYPLWSDGAAKARWVYLPPGARIDTTDLDAWQFPVGTKFWKQFSFKGRKVETRLLWRTARRWEYATYVWNTGETEATLAPEGGLPDHLEIATGKRHTIPSVTQCQACHENGRFEVLGFGALQLSTDRDPLAVHGEPLTPGMVTLATLVKDDRLTPPRGDLLRTPPRIRADQPRERAALGYLSANCGSCHKTEGMLKNTGLNLKHASVGTGETGLTDTLGKVSRYTLPGHRTGTTLRIQPGSKDSSSMYYRMKLRGGRVQMPPLASVLVDEEAVALLGQWIDKDLPARK
jgi:cytochrome c553